jgi:hypothetical protein
MISVHIGLHVFLLQVLKLQFTVLEWFNIISTKRYFCSISTCTTQLVALHNQDMTDIHIQTYLYICMDPYSQGL